MTDTRALLNRISAFKQRLESMPRLLPDKGAIRNELPPRPIAEFAPSADAELPARLGERARRGLEDAQRLIAEQRRLSEHPLLLDGGDGPERDLLLAHLRETLAVVAGAVRHLRYIPEGAGEQWHWCESLEATLRAARHRIAILDGTLRQTEGERSIVHGVAQLLRDLDGDRDVDVGRLDSFVRSFMDEPASGPLRWPTGSAEDPALAIAGHAVLVCRILRRTAPAERELPLLIKAALVCDVAMLRLPPGTLSKQRWDDAALRIVEAHCSRGAATLRRRFPGDELLASLAEAHHERGDGTGYPNGWKLDQIRPEARQLAIADVYAAMLGDRPWRAGVEPRSALTDLLLQAERGLFDPALAAHLLKVGFHPVGSVVELADGCLAGVLASPRADGPPTRPVVGLLTDPEGRPHPSLIPLDLSDAEGRSIVRTLSAAERRAKLGAAHLPWAV